MIPRAHITAWRRNAPRSTDAQVERDLVLDLVQIESGAIGPVMTALRSRLDPWLGEPRRKQSEGRMALICRFESEIPPVTPLRLKIEVNTRERFAVLGFVGKTVAVANPWFEGTTRVIAYELEELLGTKLRAFHQRKKGRDFHDLVKALTRCPDLDAGKVIRSFDDCMDVSGARVSRAEFEANLAERLADPVLRADVEPLLARGANTQVDCDAVRAAEAVHRSFISRISGEPWKGRGE